ncbi:MAG: hypothetical protein QOH03_3307, partial [Kribbellaceae bacterium]|nr:hypothetical protein [Kribbellaceae bacterium]
RGSYKTATFQGLGAFVVAGGMGAGDAIGNVFRFSGEGDRCTYPSCWPLHEQTAALLAPGLLAGAAMFAMAVVVRWVPWWVRAGVPVVLWVLALTAQHLVWDSLAPIFEGPPR